MIGFIVPDSKTIQSPQIMRSQYPDVVLRNDDGLRNKWNLIVMAGEVSEHRVQTTFQTHETVFPIWRVKENLTLLYKNVLNMWERRLTSCNSNYVQWVTCWS